MPRVLIESAAAPPLALDAPDGGSLADLCDANNAPVPFSCRTASCGTCRIDVFEGGDFLSAPADDELDVLDIFGDDPKKRRLTCQAKMLPGAGVIRIKPVGDD